MCHRRISEKYWSLLASNWQQRSADLCSPGCSRAWCPCDKWVCDASMPRTAKVTSWSPLFGLSVILSVFAARCLQHTPWWCGWSCRLKWSRTLLWCCGARFKREYHILSDSPFVFRRPGFWCTWLRRTKGTFSEVPPWICISWRSRSCLPLFARFLRTSLGKGWVLYRMAWWTSRPGPCFAAHCDNPWPLNLENL